MLLVSLVIMLTTFVLGIGCLLVRYAKRLYLTAWVLTVLGDSPYLNKVYYLAKKKKKKVLNELAKDIFKEKKLLTSLDMFLCNI